MSCGHKCGHDLAARVAYPGACTKRSVHARKSTMNVTGPIGTYRHASEPPSDLRAGCMRLPTCHLGCHGKSETVAIQAKPWAHPCTTVREPALRSEPGLRASWSISLYRLYRLYRLWHCAKHRSACGRHDSGGTVSAARTHLHTIWSASNWTGIRIFCSAAIAPGGLQGKRKQPGSARLGFRWVLSAGTARNACMVAVPMGRGRTDQRRSDGS